MANAAIQIKRSLQKQRTKGTNPFTMAWSWLQVLGTSRETTRIPTAKPKTTSEKASMRGGSIARAEAVSDGSFACGG